MEARLSGIPLPALLRLAQPMTDEQFLAFSRENKPYKMEREANGDVLIMTPAGIGTGERNRRIIQWLGVWSDKDGRGLAFDSNTGFTMPDGSIRSPDAAWLSRAKYETLSEYEAARFGRVCPEFVIELRSQSDSIREGEAKLEQWIANGAELGWLIDPYERTVTVYRPAQLPYRIEHPSEVAGEGPVAGFVLPLDRIFA